VFCVAPENGALPDCIAAWLCGMFLLYHGSFYLVSVLVRCMLAEHYNFGRFFLGVLAYIRVAGPEAEPCFGLWWPRFCD